MLAATKAQPEMKTEGTGLARLLVSLYEMENLYAAIADAYGYAAIEAMGVGEELDARRYAYLAIESGLLYGGEMDADVRRMERLLREKRDHWSWKFRMKGLGSMEASGGDVSEEDEEEDFDDDEDED
jgi:hypothetical protein